MSDHAEAQLNANEPISLAAAGSKLMPIGLGLGVVGLGAAAALGISEPKRLASAYLVGFTFFSLLSMAGLFFVLTHHLSRAGWSVVVRRVGELIAANIGTMIILSIPVLVFIPHIYEWAEPAVHERIHHHHPTKAAWLSHGFFAVRIVAYMAIWLVIARWYLKRSLAQDQTGDRGLTLSMQNHTGLHVIFFALSASLFCFDILMTLTPDWFSTMFAVYSFSGAMISFWATMVLLFRYIQSGGILKSAVTVEHYHDMGKWLFAFTFFWGYVSYSQYMLMWYGNISEEIHWWALHGASTNPQTQHEGWGTWMVILLIFHLLIPFPCLFSRWSKRILPMLTFWSVWMIVFQFVDDFWIIMPNVQGNIGKSLILSALCWLGVGGFWLAGWAWLAGARPLAPLKDPRLSESLAFENY